MCVALVPVHPYIERDGAKFVFESHLGEKINFFVVFRVDVDG
jgi:hypothetical protein